MSDNVGLSYWTIARGLTFCNECELGLLQNIRHEKKIRHEKGATSTWRMQGRVTRSVGT